MITLQQVEAQISRNVEQWRQGRGATKKFIAAKLGMSRDTYDRRLIDGGWSFREVCRAADALGISSSELVPAEFLNVNQDAA